MELNIKLTLEELNLILDVIGKLPNSSNTYGLLMKIKDQGVEQVKMASMPEKMTTE